MATRVLADEDLEALRGFPEIGREELARFFTLTPADVAFIDPGRGRGPADRLGLAVTLCSLPWLGFVPDDVAAAPQAAVVRLAGRLQVDPAALRLYGRRAKTRTEHLRLAARYRRPFGSGGGQPAERPVGLPAAPSADLRVGRGVVLIGVPQDCLSVRVAEAGCLFLR